MEFTFETVYDQKAMTSLVRGIRKVLRKRQNTRTKWFGSFAVFLGLLLLFSTEAMDNSIVTFHENGYHSVSTVGESEFPYSAIQCIIDTGDYFVLAFGPSHGQVYSKQSIRGGTIEDFMMFLAEKTGKTIEKV